MDYVIAILLIAITIYFLVNNNGENKHKNTEKTKFLGKQPAFTERDWDEAVSAWFSVSYEHDTLAYPLAPGFFPWEPPEYKEVMYDRSQLEKLREMTKYMQEDINNLMQKQKTKN